MRRVYAIILFAITVLLIFAPFALLLSHDWANNEQFKAALAMQGIYIFS
jgi:hypothetical protein